MAPAVTASGQPWRPPPTRGRTSTPPQQRRPRALGTKMHTHCGETRAMLRGAHGLRRVSICHTLCPKSHADSPPLRSSTLGLALGAALGAPTLAKDAGMGVACAVLLPPSSCSPTAALSLSASLLAFLCRSVEGPLLFSFCTSSNNPVEYPPHQNVTPQTPLGDTMVGEDLPAQQNAVRICEFAPVGVLDHMVPSVLHQPTDTKVTSWFVIAWLLKPRNPRTQPSPSTNDADVH